MFELVPVLFIPLFEIGFGCASRLFIGLFLVCLVSYAKIHSLVYYLSFVFPSRLCFPTLTLQLTLPSPLPSLINQISEYVLPD